MLICIRLNDDEMPHDTEAILPRAHLSGVCQPIWSVHMHECN